MKKQWSILILGSSIGLMFLLYACSTLQSIGTTEPAVPTVEIDKEIHFLTPEGEDVMVAPGEYEVRAEKEGLRLIAEEGVGGESMVIEAQSTNHQEKITAPTTLSFSDKEDEKMIVLLLPDGRGWEAQGSYSGVISREAPRGSSKSRTRWAQTLAMRNKLLAKATPLSLSAVSVRYSEMKKTYGGRKWKNTWRLPVSDTLHEGAFTFVWSGYQVGVPSSIMRKPSLKLLIDGKATKSPQMKSAKGGNLMTSVNLSFARANTWPKTVQLEITNGKKKWESAPTKIYANAMSYYATVLHPIFSHERCTTCHTLGTRQAIVAMHQERLGADSYADVPDAIPHNPDFCGSCHNTTGSGHTDIDLNNEWFSPAAIQGINWKGWSAGRVCAKVTGPFTNKDGVTEPPFDHEQFDHHFEQDPRIEWAVASGWVPFDRPELPVPMKGNFQGWVNKTRQWVDAGTPCPKWRFFKRPGRLQPGQLPRR